MAWRTLNLILLLYVFAAATALSIDTLQVTRSVPLTLTWHRDADDPKDGWFFKKSDEHGTSPPLMVSSPGDPNGQLPITFNDPEPFRLIAFDKHNSAFTSFGPITAAALQAVLPASTTTQSTAQSTSSGNSQASSQTTTSSSLINAPGPTSSTSSTTSVMLFQSSSSSIITSGHTLLFVSDQMPNPDFSSTITQAQSSNISTTFTSVSTKSLSPSEITTILDSVLGSVILMICVLIGLLCYRSRQRRNEKTLRKGPQSRHWYAQPPTTLLPFTFPNAKRPFSRSSFIPSSLGPDDSISQVASRRYQRPRLGSLQKLGSEPSRISPIAEDHTTQDSDHSDSISVSDELGERRTSPEDSDITTSETETLDYHPSNQSARRDLLLFQSLRLPLQLRRLHLHWPGVVKMTCVLCCAYYLLTGPPKGWVDEGDH